MELANKLHIICSICPACGNETTQSLYECFCAGEDVLICHSCSEMYVGYFDRSKNQFIGEKYVPTVNQITKG